MNNKLNQNFSLRKLLLSAFVAGPLAVLPAPLWALPDTAATNLTTSSGITLSGVTNGGTGVLNVNASANNQILTWQSFNIGAADTINYLLPATTSSILNNVTGGASTLAGAINSNGNVYVLNPAGILISQTAVINTGGFYASTVSEPSSFFSTTGTLNFTGSATADITLTSDGSAAPTIQSIGTGNKITLAGRSVLVEGANFYGDVRLQSASNGVVNLAQPAGTTTAQNGSNVNVNKASGLGGNLTIVTNGGSTSLTGAPVTVAPTITITPGGALALTTPGNVGLGGSGYAPNTTVALSITAPLIRQSLNTTTTASTNVGTTAVGFATTDAKGQITGYTLTNAGAGYITTAATTATPGGLIGQQITVVPAQVGFATNVAGNTVIDTSGSTANGNVTAGQIGIGANIDLSRFTSTGSTTITTGLAGSSTAAGNITLNNSALSSLTLPLAGTVSVIEADGFTLGNSKIQPNQNNNALVLRARAGNIGMVSGAKVEVVPSVVAFDPGIALTANGGGVTYSGTGSLRISTLSTTTASAGVSSITATGNITIPNFSSPSLTLTTTGGDITTGALSTTQGTANQVSATLTASGNVTVNGNINTTGKIVANAGGTLTITGSNTALMTAGAGLDLKSVGNLTIGSATNVSAGISAGTDAKIESTAGSVSIPGGFSGAGTITAANDVTIGTSIAATATLNPGVFLDTNSTTWKLGSGTISNMGGLYAPNTTVPVTLTNPTGGVNGSLVANTNGSGQITSVTVLNPGSGYGAAAGATFAAVGYTVPAPTNAIVSGGTLAVKATNGTVNIGGPVVGTGNVSVTSGGALNVRSVTAPTLSLVSTTGAISQTAGSTITSTGTTTLNAGSSVALNEGTNNFGTVVVLNSPAGASIADTNAVILGNATDAKGNVSIRSGTGLTATVGAATALASPNVTSTSGVANFSGGSVTGVTLTTVGTGYAPNATIGVTFSAPPAKTTLGTVLVNAASTGQNVAGYKLGAIGTEAAALQAVVLPVALGNGFAPNTEVDLFFNGTATVTPLLKGVVNGNGQIASVKVLNPGSGVTAVTSITMPAGTVESVTAAGNLLTNSQGQVTSVSITEGGSGYLGSYAPSVGFPAAATGTIANITPTFTGSAVTGATINAAGSGYVTAPTIAATGGLPAFTTTINAAGAITSVTPVVTGGVQLGAAASDVIKVAGNLTLTSAGPAGTVGLAKYSELTTVANSVSVVGNVSLNTNGANATFGLTAPIGSTPTITSGALLGSVGAGTLTVLQSTNLNLGAITAGSLKATSVSGNITNSGKLAIANTSEFSANSIFAPGTITLSDTTSTFGGTITLVNGKDIVVKTANIGTTDVNVGSATINGVTTGSVDVATEGALNLNVAGNGNLGKVTFAAKGAVAVSDGTNADGLTLENLVTSGAGTVSVTAAGPITLGSGIKLGNSGATSITSTGSGAVIKDSGAGASIFGAVNLTSGNNISLTALGHSFGPVSLTSGTNGAGVGATSSSNISYTEAGTARLANVNIGGISGSLVVSSTAGSIDQLVGSTITVPNPTLNATPTVSFTSATGGVTLGNNNNIVPAVNISAVGNSSITQAAAQELVLGNIAVTGGTFAATTTNIGTAISQATGTTARSFGAPTFTTSGGKVTLTNTGNNFGGITVNTTAGAQLTGAAVAITEAGTLNLLAVNTGTAATSNLALTSETGSIISTVTPLALRNITVGGNTTLTSAADVTLNQPNNLVNNNFGNKPITISAAGNVSIQDNNATTTIGGGTDIKGNLTVYNSFGNPAGQTSGTGTGTIRDTVGDIKVFGNVSLTTGTAGTVNITSSSASFGAVKFNSGTVTIFESKTLNIAAGSTANGAVSLTSGENIITTGTGGASITGATGSLSLNANGNITITNPIFVNAGLTFRALGAVDLKALSVTGNLNGITPINLGAASYAAPSP